MMNLEGAPQPLPKIEIAIWDWPKRWIMSRLDDTIREVHRLDRRLRIQRGRDEALPIHLARVLLTGYIELSKEPLKSRWANLKQARDGC